MSTCGALTAASTATKLVTLVYLVSSCLACGVECPQCMSPSDTKENNMAASPSNQKSTVFNLTFLVSICHHVFK